MVTLMVLVGDVIWTEAMNDYGDNDIYDDLNCPGGDVTIAGVHPGQVAVARSHQDLKLSFFSRTTKTTARKCWTYVVIFFGNLLSTIGNVASVMLRVHLVCVSYVRRPGISEQSWVNTNTGIDTGLSTKKIIQRISPFPGKGRLRVQPCRHREGLHLKNSTSGIPE